MVAIDHEIMPFGLSCNRFIDSGIQKIIAFRRAEWTTEVGVVVLAKAHIQRTGASDPDSIAGFAKIVRERGNETQPSAGFLHTHITRRSTRNIVGLFKCISLGEARPYHGHRQILIDARLHRRHQAA